MEEMVVGSSDLSPHILIHILLGGSNTYLGTSFSTPNVHSPDCTQNYLGVSRALGVTPPGSHRVTCGQTMDWAVKQRGVIYTISLPPTPPATGVPSPQHPSHFRDEKISVTYLLFGCCMNFLQLL